MAQIWLDSGSTSLFYKDLIFKGRNLTFNNGAPDFWDRGPGFESGISNNDPDGLQYHWVK